MKYHLICCVLITTCSYGQESYKASNGILYKIGDFVTLGRGTGPGGKFVYFEIGGMARSTDAEMNMQPSNMAGLTIQIKKIKNWKLKGQDRIYFVTDGSTSIANGYLFIENAIASGEVVTPGMTSDQALAELKRAKDKLDLGLITQAKYDSIKAELTKYIK